MQFHFWNKPAIIVRLVAEKIYTTAVNWLHQEIVTKITFLNCQKNFADPWQMLNWENLAVCFPKMIVHPMSEIMYIKINLVTKEVMIKYASSCQIVRYCTFQDFSTVTVARFSVALNKWSGDWPWGECHFLPLLAL